MPCTFNGISGKALALIGALLLAGCQHFAQGNRTADYPIGTQFPQIYQQQLQASAHWQLIAHNEAHLLVTRFDEAPSLRLNPRGGGGQSAFDRAYHDFLAEGLLNEGALLFDAGDDARVEYDIEVIDYSARSQLNLPPGFISTTVLSAYIIGHAVEAWSNPAALLIPAAIGADFYQYMNADSIRALALLRSEGLLFYEYQTATSGLPTLSGLCACVGFRRPHSLQQLLRG